MIIGISGKKRRGKDDLADHPVQYLDYEHDYFARPIKQIARIVYGFNSRQLYGDLKEVTDPFWDVTPRRVMQKIGGELFRDQVCDDIWVRSLLKRVQGKNVVVSDLRYQNEAQALKEKGAFLIRIEANERVPYNSSSLKTWACQWMPSLTSWCGPEYHPSETELDDYDGWDVVIDNNGTLEEYRSSFDSLIHKIKKQ